MRHERVRCHVLVSSPDVYADKKPEVFNQDRYNAVRFWCPAVFEHHETSDIVL